MARRGHGLPRDAVDLVEGVGPQQPVISRADEELQGQGVALRVSVELWGGTETTSETEPGHSEVQVSAWTDKTKFLFRIFTGEL